MFRRIQSSKDKDELFELLLPGNHVEFTFSIDFYICAGKPPHSYNLRFNGQISIWKLWSGVS